MQGRVPPAQAAALGQPGLERRAPRLPENADLRPAAFRGRDVEGGDGFGDFRRPGVRRHHKDRVIAGVRVCGYVDADHNPLTGRDEVRVQSTAFNRMGESEFAAYFRLAQMRFCDRNIRDLAWVVVRWAEEARPDVICMENVEEFVTWGPVGEDGRPIREFAGMTL
nr:hypothetical protein [Rhodovulum sulfidophilum]